MTNPQYNRGKPTACLCGGAGFRYRNGWICKRCDEIEDRDARRATVRNAKTQSPIAKYADTYTIGNGMRSVGNTETKV